jgi:hypothetical protein
MTKAQRVCSTIILLFTAVVAHAQTTYFPPNTLEKAPQEFLREWYSTYLATLKEPSLFELAHDTTTYSYRFLWLRSFNNPVAIRLNVNADGTGTLIQKVASGEAGFRPGYLTISNSKPITRQQTQYFLQKVHQVDFWSMPTIDPVIGGEDGSEWIIEGVHDGKYHVVNRWSPSSGPIHELGLALVIDLAGMNIPARELY